MFTGEIVNQLVDAGLTDDGVSRLRRWTGPVPEVTDVVERFLFPTFERNGCGLTSDVGANRPVLHGAEERLVRRLCRHMADDIEGLTDRRWFPTTARRERMLQRFARLASHRLVAPVTVRAAGQYQGNVSMSVGGQTRDLRYSSVGGNVDEVLTGDQVGARATGRGRWWWPATSVIHFGDTRPRDLYICPPGRALLGAFVLRLANDNKPFRKDPRPLKIQCEVELWGLARVLEPDVLTQPLDELDGASTVELWVAGERDAATRGFLKFRDRYLDQPMNIPLSRVSRRDMLRLVHRGCGTSVSVATV